MSMNNRMTKENAINARYQTLIILWAAQLMALFMFVLLAALVFGSSRANNPSLFWVLAAASLLLVAVSFPLKQKFFAQAVEKQSPALVQQGQVVAVALCEAAGLFGLLARVITGSPYFYLLFAVAGIGMLLHFPRREALVAATFRNRV